MTDERPPLLVPVRLPVDWLPPPPTPSSRPFVTLAAVCDRALTDKSDDVSLIRLVDRIEVAYRQPSTAVDTTGRLALTREQYLIRTDHVLVIVVKGVGSTVTHELGIVETQTDGERQVMDRFQFDLPPATGADEYVTSATFLLNLVLRNRKEDGLIWLEIFLDDDYATRIPLEVVRSREG